jgi:uncharacterized protein (DUF58 family)
LKYSIDHNRFQQFDSIEFIARQVVEGFITGLHKSPFHGFSVEFAEHRLYNSGESTKHIDWKLYGRTDRLYVKKYEEETNLRCCLVIDNSSSMYFPIKENLSIDNPNKITFSVYAAAALMNLLKRQRDAVGLNVFSNKVDLSTQLKSGSVHQKYLYSELEKMLIPEEKERKAQTSAAISLHKIAESIHKRSLVVIFSDMFETSSKPDELFAALQHLKHNKHEVILFHVVDKNKEEDFDFENRPHRFIDMESGEEMKINPVSIKKNYVNSVLKFKKNLKLRCAQYKIDFIEADINKGFEQILFPYLVKRKKLH